MVKTGGSVVNWLKSLIVVAACVAIGVRTATADEPESAKSSVRPQLFAVLIGGWDSEPTPEQIAGTAQRNQGNSGMFQLADDLRRERVVCEYFNWNGTRAGELKTPRPPLAAGIVRCIRMRMEEHPYDRLAIVGNSWGGHTALEVTQLLARHEQPLAVNLVVFLDASSAGRALGPPKSLPVNVNGAAHFFTRNSFVWGRCELGTNCENIDLGDPDNGFMIDGRPAYHAAFDFKAHVAAEWDGRIHADIKRRLLRFQPAE
jgi:pimeloyl-ACP methyl ester carboxylesterase